MLLMIENLDDAARIITFTLELLEKRKTTKSNIVFILFRKLNILKEINNMSYKTHYVKNLNVRKNKAHKRVHKYLP